MEVEEMERMNGLSKNEKRRMVRVLVKKHCLTMLFIQELKLQNFNKGVIRSLGGIILTRVVGVDAVGKAEGELLNLKKEMVFCNVYTPNDEFEKRNLWDFIISTQATFPEFHRDSSIVKDLNKTFIVLIPKCPSPESMKDFKPISLVGFMYKILVKVLANRIKEVMNSIIGEVQMDFVGGQRIIDGFDPWKLYYDVRDGDRPPSRESLSSFLFNIAIEELNCLIRKATESNMENMAAYLSVEGGAICVASHKENIPVRSLLVKFGVNVTLDTDCILCNSGEESVDHLFLSCPWTWRLWLSCMKWFDVKSCSSASL
ncbi:hypothetical protein Ddye_026016 [Dipteronia dyeriana]|uniref:Reverse transcriptase zinc-binding domain-containing protein n=1 Tax=Dipteronia dyeriana TaxID=168575 RepID=A0AAD9WP38_9ROSI|nr:hypothetical protein Ddye_026016 [Dipteronia dyeriana]